ncbi:MAG: hypothetical protein IH598_07625 [Bacteroidales bacterium]|nr:hypothetical protein [Bacteroidales bacterium]
MRIRLVSEVNRPFDWVSGHFDKELFVFLLPPPFVARLIRYDGSDPGNLVHIRFLLPWRSDWISKIISSKRNTEAFEFVDIGEKLPFGLKTWKHQHIVKKLNEKQSQIIDDMSFSTCCKIFDLLIYPVLYLAFSPRKQLYKRYFEKTEAP